MPITKITAATKSIEEAVGQAKQNLEGLVKAQQEQLEKAQAQLLKSYDDLAALSKQNVDAVVLSGSIVAKGAEEAGKQLAAFTQASLEKNAAAGKALMGIKSVRELIDFQNAFVKQSFDALVAETTKLQELSVKVTSEAIAPLSARVNATVETFAKPIAA
ncbi:MAG TPA: TIGR01841 family phasin [Azospirillum sp.]